MWYNVILCGLGNKGEIRPVFVDSKLRPSRQLAALVFHNGQNEIQNKSPYHTGLRSVSVGDIIVLEDGEEYYLVEPIGFKMLTMEDAYSYIASFRV